MRQLEPEQLVLLRSHGQLLEHELVGRSRHNKRVQVKAFFVSQESQLVFDGHNDSNKVGLEAVCEDKDLVDRRNLQENRLQITRAYELPMTQLDQVLDPVDNLDASRRHQLPDIATLDETILSEKLLHFIRLF